MGDYVWFDENGHYSFDDLPALDNGGTCTVCIDRDASAGALEGYQPTSEGAGERADDSSTWQATTEPGDLTADGDRDPTLDFGCVITPAPPTTPDPTTTSDASTTTPAPTTDPASSTLIAPAITTTVAPDTCVTLTEDGFEPGETVTITITDKDGSDPRTQTVTADADGVVEYCVSAGESTTVQVEVAGQYRTVIRDVTIDVRDDSGSLSYTGFGAVRYVGLALLLLAGGAVVIGVMRRRDGRHA